ncbi:MAG: hypothetical protein KAH38_03435, partial [Candidatus Hydrogenedentes bacterium]|nr:hypothetical protein [Candidatus Hydrogenedentota bacterium]
PALTGALSLITDGTFTGDVDIPTQAGALLESFFTAEKDGVSAMILYATEKGDLLQAIADQSIDISAIAPGFGNGATDTIRRFSEGVERFMITDINNPGASAMSQSNLFVMSDLIGTGAGMTEFNHIPGGCNVLYMDGHVSFVRYVSDVAVSTPPVMATWGNLIGTLSEAGTV